MVWAQHKFMANSMPTTFKICTILGLDKVKGNMKAACSEVPKLFKSYSVCQCFRLPKQIPQVSRDQQNPHPPSSSLCPSSPTQGMSLCPLCDVGCIDGAASPWNRGAVGCSAAPVPLVQGAVWGPLIASTIRENFCKRLCSNRASIACLVLSQVKLTCSCTHRGIW